MVAPTSNDKGRQPERQRDCHGRGGRAQLDPEGPARYAHHKCALGDHGMGNTMVKRTQEVVGSLLALTLASSTGVAWAADAPPTTAAPGTLAQAGPPPSTETPVLAAPAAAPPAPAAAPTVTPADKPDLKKIDIGFALRVGSAAQGATDRSKVNDIGLDEFTVEARFSGNLTEIFAWQANFNGGIPVGPNSMGASTAGSNGFANVLDLIAKVEPAQFFHFWAGRMLVPSDRSNFSGPWFMSPWKYPGFYPTLAAPVGPKQGPFGRNDGVTAWGQFLEGKAKYYVGVFDLNDTTVSPLYTGRINICFLGKEPGFYHSSTYYGAQDIVALGLGAQYQKNGSGDPTTMPANLKNYMADLLAEKNFAGVGVGTLEGSYYKFDTDQQFKQAFYVLGSYLFPKKLGIGKLQLLGRYQQADPSAGGTSWKMEDAFLTYLVDDYFLRASVGYQHADIGVPPNSNAVLLGIQMQR